MCANAARGIDLNFGCPAHVISWSIHQTEAEREQELARGVRRPDMVCTGSQHSLKGKGNLHQLMLTEKVFE